MEYKHYLNTTALVHFHLDLWILRITISTPASFDSFNFYGHYILRLKDLVSLALLKKHKLRNNINVSLGSCAQSSTYG